MKMFYCLEAVFTAVDDHSVAVFESKRCSNILDLRHHISHEIRVFIRHIIDRRDMLFRYHQYMYRSLRIRIVEAEYPVILVSYVRLYLTVVKFS